MKILVTGASGLLGRKVVQIALEEGHEAYAIYKEHLTSSGTPIKLDLTNLEELSKILSERKPDTVIHTAAYTDVDGCEVNRELAWRVNADATKYLAMASSQIGFHLIYVSTDYVFDGEKGFYTEEDEPNPISYYGYSKLRGEEFLKEYATDWCIARPSVLYGWGPRYKKNFATWLLNNLKQGREVEILIDQYVSPTLNTNLAQMLLEIAERKITGTLHTAGATKVNRYEFALKLAETFNLNKNLIKPTTMNKIRWTAKRPKDSSLNVNRATTLLNHKPLNLEHAFEVMKKEKTLKIAR